MKVIPTILTNTIEEFKTQMKLFPRYFDRIQLDVADGKLVPNKTTQIEQMIDLMANHKLQITSKTQFDFHLMVEDYKGELEKIKKISQYISVNTALVNAALHPKLEELAQIYSFTIGLDISSNSSIEEVAYQYNLNTTKGVQIMTIESGFQGQPFIPELLNKVEQLRNNNYRGPIFMDGGINDQTIPLILAKKHQPDFACVGSYLTKAGDKFEERIQYLNTIIK